jgi:hypothetical protein
MKIEFAIDSANDEGTIEQEAKILLFIFPVNPEKSCESCPLFYLHCPPKPQLPPRLIDNHRCRVRQI